MLTIFVSPYNVPVVTTDGYEMTVKLILVRNKDTLSELRGQKQALSTSDIEIVFFWRFLRKRINLPPNVRQAVKHYLRYYQGKQDYSYDCYAFANTVHNLPAHTVPNWKQYWKARALPKRKQIGSVVFLINKDGSYFHHAAVYIGLGMYLSVYGAGGDLEIATLKEMIAGYGADKVLMAVPK